MIHLCLSRSLCECACCDMQRLHALSVLLTQLTHCFGFSWIQKAIVHQLHYRYFGKSRVQQECAITTCQLSTRSCTQQHMAMVLKPA